MTAQRWKIAALAFMMSVLTWYLVTGRDLVETWVEFPMEIINPPQGMIIRDGMITKVSARLRGPKGLIRNLDTKKLAYSLDTGHLVVGNNPVDIIPERLGLGSALEVVEIKPSHINLVMDMYVKKNVSVIPTWKGELHRDYTLKTKYSEPVEVTLRGPASILKRIAQIRTQPIMFDTDSPGNWSGEVPLDLPDEVEANPGTVNVFIEFAVRKGKMWIKVPLYILGPDDIDFAVSQNYVRLLVEGPKPFFRRNGFRDEITASIDLNATIPAGENVVPFDVSLPKGCTVIKTKPEAITVTISRQTPETL
ncbi:CdaR family protein [Maridesulfovibrio hydrothermalis]|uniref:YbbR family protein n=1 Tax=Maridesulfovibrio hydrothermalis AM13 = DSM 14728 TaxID=1121451 RepID=L0RE30_9BACT|nr:CdaR family protein [Maridesulfovibrio hydrothermalis]CCO24457.1 YbbR family protein [Maridesulfovibrio hydrothermalis AM13 = DSM 14728]